MRCTVTEGCTNQAEVGSLGCFVCGPATKPKPAADVTNRKCIVSGCPNEALKGRQYCSNACMWKKNKHAQAMRASSPALQKHLAAKDAGPEIEAPKYTKPPPVPPAFKKIQEDFDAGRVLPSHICLDEPDPKELRPAMEFLARCAGAMEDMPGVRRVGLMVWVDQEGKVTMEPPVFSKVD